MRHEYRFPQQVLLYDRGDHGTARIRGHRQLRHIQRVEREHIAMWRVALSGTGAVISIFAQIGSALQRSPGREALCSAPAPCDRLVVVFGKS